MDKKIKDIIKRFGDARFGMTYDDAIKEILHLFSVSKRFNFPNFIVGVMTGLTIALIYLHFAL